MPSNASVKQGPCTARENRCFLVRRGSDPASDHFHAQKRDMNHMMIEDVKTAGVAPLSVVGVPDPRVHDGRRISAQSQKRCNAMVTIDDLVAAEPVDNYQRLWQAPGRADETEEAREALSSVFEIPIGALNIEDVEGINPRHALLRMWMGACRKEGKLLPLPAELRPPLDRSFEE